jgi:hypothetical protein
MPVSAKSHVRTLTGIKTITPKDALASAFNSDARFMQVVPVDLLVTGLERTHPPLQKDHVPHVRR